MKKILAMMLTAAMMLSMGTAVWANEVEGGPDVTPPVVEPETPATPIAASKEAEYKTIIKKVYTVTGNTKNTDTVYPHETLNFTSVAATTNPDGGKANLNFKPLNVTGIEDQMLSFTVPSLSEVGTYHFTVSETATNSQGVTYSTGTIAVSVLVTYDYEDTDNDGYTMTAVVGITAGDENEKLDTFTNQYDLGSLEVSKEVTGNLGDTNKPFAVTVTFTATKPVVSDITYTDDGVEKTIPANWTNNIATAEITLKHGETVTFTDIPAGVTYVVEESAEYSADTNKNGENGYDAPTYTYSDETDKVIAKSDADTVKITNNKSTTVDTGISVDSIPYIAMLGVVAIGGTGFIVSKKRRSED